MVAFVTGSTLGLNNSSLAVIGGNGGNGILGDPPSGRAGEQVYVNAATGDLVVQRQDEFVESLGYGPATSIVRTYNSLGKLTDDNGDNWQMGVAKTLSAYTANSSITRNDGDGTSLVYTWNGTTQNYVSKNGTGAFDTLALNGSVWTWTDGDTGQTETYDATSLKIRTSTDREGNTARYGYTGSLLTSVTDAAGEVTTFAYSGNNLASITTTNADGSTASRVSYLYNASNKLASVIAQTSGGQTYVTSYSYDASGRMSDYVLRVMTGQAYANGYYYSYENDNENNVARIEAYRLKTGNVPDLGNVQGDTRNTYDDNGYLTNVATANGDGSSSTRALVNDIDGRILTKRETVNASPSAITFMYAVPSGTHVTHTLIANGEEIGSSSDANSPDNAPFAQSYVPVSDRSMTDGPSAYTVQSGDTLQSIAKRVWGDSNLWYAIAEANGFTSITAGQIITIPNRPSVQYNDFQTYRPYDPGAILGDTAPTLPVPKPPSHDSFFGDFLAIVVTVVVSVMTGGIAGAMLGSIAGQAVEMAAGNQHGFNWKQVAMSGLSMGVTEGLGEIGMAVNTADATFNAVANAAIANTITQGIGVATGLQKSFSWQAVAGSAVGAGVGQVVGGSLGLNANGLRPAGMEMGDYIARTAVKALAAGGAAALARGGKVAVQQVAVDAFGNALGQGLVDAMNQPDGGTAFAMDHANRLPLQQLNPMNLPTRTSMPAPSLAAMGYRDITSDGGNSFGDAVIVGDAPQPVEFSREQYEAMGRGLMQSAGAPRPGFASDGSDGILARTRTMYSDSAAGFIDQGGRRFYVNSRDEDGWGTYVTSQDTAVKPGIEPITNQQPNDGGYNFGKNERYRYDLERAAARTGFDPAQVAAIVNAEAASRNGVWDPDSRNPTSTAFGLTQFLKGTWLDETQRPGTTLNGLAQQNGWLDGKGRVSAEYRDDLLQLRSDASLSITAAAEYMKYNLGQMNAKGLIPAGTTGDDAIVYGYVAHHEGLRGATDLLQGTLDETRASQLLTQQAGRQADVWRQQYNTAQAAYRAWLFDYAGRQVQPNLYRVR